MKMKILMISLAAIIGLLVIYLSWIPNPAMATIHWMPRWLGEWADAYPRFRTAVPFFGLGGLVGVFFISTERMSFRNGVITWSALTGLVVACELGQLMIPRRVFDLNDILWGSVGGAAGLGIVAIETVRRRRRIKTSILADAAEKTPVAGDV